MKGYFNPGIAYILVWCLYSLQGAFYTSGGIISQTLIALLLIWSIYYFLIINFNSDEALPAFIKAVNVFLIMATIYGVILIASGQELTITEGEYRRVPNFHYLKEILTSLLPLYPIYYYVKKSYITERHLVFLLLIFIGVTWSQYFRFQSEAIENALTYGYTREEFTNNTGYTFLAILPLLLLWNKKPILQYILFLVCIAGIILCMKRGAIIIGAICAIYFIYQTFKMTRGPKKITIILLSILAIWYTVWFVRDMLVTSEYFGQRLEATLEGDSSNRDIIFNNLWNVFISETNPLIILFGRGANATLSVGMNLAHNDWLELAINQGLLGVVIYIIYFTSLLSDANRVRKTNSLNASVLYMAFVILFIRSFFSMSYGDINIILMLAIGLALGTNNNHSTNSTLAPNY